MSEEEVRGIPFWDDLFSVTARVPPWGLFKILADHPDIHVKMPVPITFLLIPGDGLTAQLSTGSDGKLEIRRNTKDTPINFEMMDSNLLQTYGSRDEDGQPYVCVVWARDDWKPRLVSKEQYSLLGLYLRVSCGVPVSFYGRDEQSRAATFFPENICCVQAYVPLARNLRYISILLRSPVRSLSEVYFSSYHVDPGMAEMFHEKQKLTKIDKYLPVNSSDPIASSIIRKTASVLGHLRTQKSVSIQGIVCEFVRNVEGQIFLTCVMRAANPAVRLFTSEIRHWKPERLKVRIAPAVVRRLSSAYTGHAVAMDSKRRRKKADDMAWRPEGFSAKGVLIDQLSVVVDDLPESHELPITAPSTPRTKPAKDVKTSSLPLSVVREAMSSDGDNRAMSSDSDSAGDEELVLDEDPNGQTTDPAESTKSTPTLSPTAKYFDAEEKTLHDMLLEQSQQLHAQGLYVEALRAVEEAEAVALELAQNLQHAPSQRDRGGKGKSLNAECFRCGDRLHAELDKLAFTHYEWREKAAARTREVEAARRAEGRSRHRHRGKRLEHLESALAKMEMTAWDDTDEVPAEVPKILPQSMCTTCLLEVEGDPRNRPLIRNIKEMRTRS